jgi:hypothetical protein
MLDRLLRGVLPFAAASRATSSFAEIHQPNLAAFGRLRTNQLGSQLGAVEQRWVTQAGRSRPVIAPKDRAECGTSAAAGRRRLNRKAPQLLRRVASALPSPQQLLTLWTVRWPSQG